MSGNIALIGGTGFEQLPEEIYAEPLEVNTRFGDVRVLSISDNYTEPYKLYFVSRHGGQHHLAPHQIDYKANTAALVELGVKYVFATNAVGSLRLDLPPHSLILLNDFIDFTRHRSLTYFNEMENWRHTDFSTPYSEELRQALITSAENLDIPLITSGTYLCCDGPRFETPSEIRLFAHWGADVVGMTGIPEVVFAHEAGLEYASLCIVTNFGSGLTSRLVDHQSVTDIVRAELPRVRELLLRAAGSIIERNSRLSG